MVQYFAFNFVPKGYAACNGALLQIMQNQALFALLGTQYGGNGTTTFGLPDLQGRVIVSQSSGHSMGEKSGVPAATLLTPNMPSHTHTATATILANTNITSPTNVATPAGNYMSGGPSLRGGTTDKLYAAPPSNGQLGSPVVTVGNAGGGVPFSTQNPYLALTCGIATVGLFPSRN